MGATPEAARSHWFHPRHIRRTYRGLDRWICTGVGVDGRELGDRCTAVPLSSRRARSSPRCCSAASSQGRRWLPTRPPRRPPPRPNPNEWSSATNAYSSNDVYATESSDDGEQGYGGFGFAIPAGSIIDGITVKVEAKSSDAAAASRGDPVGQRRLTPRPPPSPPRTRSSRSVAPGAEPGTRRR